MSHGPRPVGTWTPIFTDGEPIVVQLVWPLVVTLGCVCGLEEHPGLTCEAALACAEEERHGCTCEGYWDPDERTVEHDGFCDIFQDVP
jgi:hypothetical protein